MLQEVKIFVRRVWRGWAGRLGAALPSGHHDRRQARRGPDFPWASLGSLHHYPPFPTEYRLESVGDSPFIQGALWESMEYLGRAGEGDPTAASQESLQTQIVLRVGGSRRTLIGTPVVSSA